MPIKSAVPARRRDTRAAFLLAAAASLGIATLAQSPAHAQAQANAAPPGATVVTVTPDQSTEQLAKAMGVSIEVARQIQSLEADADSRTPAERKVC